MFLGVGKLIRIAGPLTFAGSWGGGACYGGVCRPLGKNWSIVIFLLTTISVLKSLGSVPSEEESTNSNSTYSTARAPSSGSSTRICSARLWNIVSVESSLTGSNEPTLNCQGPSLWASSGVSPGGKKPHNRMSKYDSKGLLTVSAWLGPWKLVYMGVQPRMRWDACNWQSKCMKISDQSKKFRSRTWMVLRSDLNHLVAAQSEIAISIQVKIKTTLIKQQKTDNNSKSNVSGIDQYLKVRLGRWAYWQSNCRSPEHILQPSFC